MNKILLLLLFISSTLQPMKKQDTSKKQANSRCWPWTQKTSNSKQLSKQSPKQTALDQKKEAKITLLYPHIRLCTQKIIAGTKKDLESNQPKLNKSYSSAALKTTQIALQHIDTLAQLKETKPILDEAEPLAALFSSSNQQPDKQNPKFQRLSELMSSSVLESALCSLDPEYAKFKKEIKALEKANQVLNKQE
jgi:hypothetical protein